MIADQQVRDAVLDISRSFLVQAPAGSGKTSLLVQRYLKLLASVQQFPEEILAITFTRKAAAEMRARVLEALQLAQQPLLQDDAYHKTLWELGHTVLQRDKTLGWDLLDNPARLKIQTIDALSSAIAAQMPITAQFGSNPQIEPAAESLYDAAVDQFLFAASADSPWLEDLNILLLHLDNDRSKIKKLLMHMLECRDQWLPIVIGTLQQHAIRETLENALQMVNEQSLDNIANNIPPFLDFNILQRTVPQTVAEWLEVVKILLTENNHWRKTVNAAHGFPPQSTARDKDEKLIFKQRKQAMEQILEDLQPCSLFKTQLIAISKLPPPNYSNEQWHVLQALYTILPLVVAQLTLVFKEHGVVDFTAVTLAALRALDLQEPGANLALALDCKIQHILVDEFQDTSLLQYTMLEQLTASWDSYDGKTLFLVGDPMQSIYRFRKAEVGLFLKAKQFGINNIQLNFAQLQVNFRSEPALVNWFNQVFSAAFPDQDDIDFGAISYMPSQAVQENNATQPAVHCYTATALTEAAKIIAIIQEIQPQQPTASIAILVRAKAHLVDIIPALRAAQINFCAVELESLAQSQCIQDLLALTKALLHLDDRIAWLAILRAPWCGLLLRDLLIIAEHPTTIWSALNAAAVTQLLSHDAQSRLAKFVIIMQNALNLLGRESLDIIVQKLWNNLAGPACLQNPDLQVEAQMYFVFLARQAQDPQIYTPGFLEKQLRHLYLHVTHVDPNAVQIMTMHKAKGLEFDVVILPRLGKKVRGDSQKLLLLEQRNDPAEALIMAPIKSATDMHDPIYNYVMWCENQRHEYEALRQLYVAVTRARKQLYCIGHVNKKGPSEQSLLARIWGVAQTQFMPLPALAATLAEAKTQTVIHRLPPSNFKNLPLIEHAQTFEYTDRSSGSDLQRVIGIVMHRTLWQIATDGIATWHDHKIKQQENSWVQQLRQLGILAHDIEAAVQLLTQAMNNTLNEKFGQIILANAHAESYAEWPLTVLQQDEAMNIVIDRAFLDTANNFWIVDYKFVLDAAEIPAALEIYQAQMAKYVNAVAQLYPARKIISGLYFPLQAIWRAQ